MATVTVKSNAITNRDAAAKTLNNSILERGIVRQATATVEVATGDSAGSKYLLVSVPSNARIVSVQVTSDDMGTATTADFGVFQTTANGGAVVDQDFFGSTVSLNGGALTKSEIMHESGAYDPDDVEKALWSALGLSADSNRNYDIAATLIAAADTGGTLSIHVSYVI